MKCIIVEKFTIHGISTFENRNFWIKSGSPKLSATKTENQHQVTTLNHFTHHLLIPVCTPLFSFNFLISNSTQHSSCYALDTAQSHHRSRRLRSTVVCEKKNHHNAPSCSMTLCYYFRLFPPHSSSKNHRQEPPLTASKNCTMTHLPVL